MAFKNLDKYKSDPANPSAPFICPPSRPAQSAPIPRMASRSPPPKRTLTTDNLDNLDSLAVDRVMSGMILTSTSRSITSAPSRQRSMSATGKLFAPRLNWADEMDRNDELLVERIASSKERLQSGLAPMARLPPGLELKDLSTFRETPAPKAPSPVPPNAFIHDPYGDSAYPYSDRATENLWSHHRPQPFLYDFEEMLKERTISLMEDEAINRFHGSVPVEKIQNILTRDDLELYNKVVGTTHRSWNRFIAKHYDTFELFSVDDGKWRMRLVWHNDFKRGDEKERAARKAEDLHFLKALSLYLNSTTDGSCTVDDFMEVYPELSCNQVLDDGYLQYPLPKRGDFVRFVKRHPDALHFNHKKFLITLAQRTNRRR